MPYCGNVPGQDEATRDWHSGHDRDLLIESVSFGPPGCLTCLSRLSPEALGGFTPLILEDE
ncbi:hypothetical protein [Nonomuraea harbinensis]|uniref:Uncharacterized protein n=1 Tax=Nonomuraea harbinensis TaxID=1286938 RepID=A0ABW1C6K1_9ACTN|nr:hypothetical protein [Nonomuraea harbinensis]